MSKNGKYVFLDRDGTIGGNYDMEFPTDFYPYPHSQEGIDLLEKAGFTLIIVSNQSCIARKKDHGFDFKSEYRAMGIDDEFICPHDQEDGCDCRKPASGLFYQAQKKYGMDLTQSYMIGDRWSDMVAGGAVGVHLILVTTGRGKEALQIDREKWNAYRPDYVCSNLLEAACWIMKGYK